MTDAELLAAYDPSERDSPVALRLKARSQGKPCLIFDGISGLIVGASLRMLDEIRQGLPEVSQTIWEGKFYKAYRIGEQPNIVFDENPLYPGQPLRSGQMCAISGLNWQDIPLTSRQLLYLAVVKTGELAPMNHVTAESAFQWAKGDSLRRRLPKAAILFDDLAQTGSLPTLKIKPGPVPSGAREGRKVQL